MRKFLVFPNLRCVLIVHANVIFCSSVKIFTVLPWNLLYPALLCRWKEENQNYWQWTESCLEWSKSIKEGGGVVGLWIYTEWDDLCPCFCFFNVSLWLPCSRRSLNLIWRAHPWMRRHLSTWWWKISKQSAKTSKEPARKFAECVICAWIPAHAAGEEAPWDSAISSPLLKPPLGVAFCVF